MFNIKNPVSKPKVVKPKITNQFECEFSTSDVMSIWRIATNPELTEFDFILKVGGKYMRSMVTGIPYRFREGYYGKCLRNQRNKKDVEVYKFTKVVADVTFKLAKDNKVT